MPWREFKMLVDEAFRLHGFGVSEAGGADGGVDLPSRRAQRSFSSSVSLIYASLHKHGARALGQVLEHGRDTIRA